MSRHGAGKRRPALSIRSPPRPAHQHCSLGWPKPNLRRPGCEPRYSRAARLPAAHGVLEGQAQQINGFIEAINGLFQAAKRKARGYTRFETVRTVLFPVAGKLDFSAFNAHAR